MSIELLKTFKTQAIVDVYNHLNPEAQIKDWAKNKSILVERIVAKFDTATIEKAIADTEPDTKPGKPAKPAKVKKTKAPKAKAPKAKAEKKADGEKPKRQAGVGAYVRELLAKSPETPALDILAAVQKKYPEAKTSVACIGWYRSRMYKSGDLKKTAVAKARKAEAA